MDVCKINWGADSRNASNTPDPKASFLSVNISSEFVGKLVSISNSPINNLKFLQGK